MNIRFALILLLSAITGFISLSQELLWFRLISFATANSPRDFGHLLGFFLLGIALGAFVAQKVLRESRIPPLTCITLILGVAAVVFYGSVPLIGHMYTFSLMTGTTIAFFLIMLVAFLMGGIFPILCHHGIQSSSAVGYSVSWIYLANIVGATTGPLITGFVLMNHFSLEDLVLYSSLITLAVAGLVFISGTAPVKIKVIALIGAGFIWIVTLQMHAPFYSDLLARLQYKEKYYEEEPLSFTLQNRSGIVTVASDSKDILFGHGVYDGRFNIDPHSNENWITRAFMLAVLHPSPKHVLMVGLGSGSWARVMTLDPRVESLIAVEINPGYSQVIEKYPSISSIFEDQKFELHIDDGRRWLVRHPETRFDFIVMNTTYHWRGNSTNLLSVQFLRLCKKHLRSGGVIYYNSTGLEDNFYTAAHVFRYVTKFGNFVAASDAPFNMPLAQRKKNLLGFTDGKLRIFQPHKNRSKKLWLELAQQELPDLAAPLRRRTDLFLITDNNMAPEYKSNALEKRLIRRNSWYQLWKRLFHQ